MENLWVESSYFVALSLCTLTKLDHNIGQASLLYEKGAADCSAIYFKLRLGSEEHLTPARGLSGQQGEPMAAEGVANERLPATRGLF